MSSRFASCEDFQSPLKAISLERFPALSVVERIVRVEPIALRVHFEIGDFRQFWCLNEKLLLGPKNRDELDLVLVEIELAAIQIPVHVRVGKEDFRRAAFYDDVEDF